MSRIGRASFCVLMIASSALTAGAPRYASIHGVLTSPVSYEGDSVSLSGYLQRYRADQGVLFFSETHAQMNDVGNAILIDNKWATNVGFSLENCTGAYVQIDGNIRMEDDYPVISDLVSAYGFARDDLGGFEKYRCEADSK